MYKYSYGFNQKNISNNWVKFIFAWPNFINLKSYLKDPTYLNNYPIITWQHRLKISNYKYEEEDGYFMRIFVIINLNLKLF